MNNELNPNSVYFNSAEDCMAHILTATANFRPFDYSFHRGAWPTPYKSFLWPYCVQDRMVKCIEAIGTDL